MNCQWQDVPDSTDARGWRKTRCVRCGHITAPWPNEPGHEHYRACSRPTWCEWASHFLTVAVGIDTGRIARFFQRVGNVKTEEMEPLAQLPAETQREIVTQAESRGVLLGNMIAAMTKAVGVPPCGGCEKRREWLNRVHSWLRGDQT